MWRGFAFLALSIALLVALPGCRPGRAGGVEACVPGETLQVGCALGCGLGECAGDPRLRVCEGSLGVGACEDGASGAVLEDVDDSACGRLCPFASVQCPASGSIAVVTTGSCDWDVAHLGIVVPGGREACTPGAALEVGCASGCGLGACTGDPVMIVCDGSMVADIDECLAASAPAQISRVDDTTCGSRCPFISFTCPASGEVVVAHRPFSTGGTYSCDWSLRAAIAP